MSAKGNPYENTIAERVNGIIKNEFLYHYNYQTKQELYKTVGKAVQVYNNERPHMSCGMP
jgi:transposase InsO family protein